MTAPALRWQVYSHGLRHFREYHSSEREAHRVAQQMRDAGFYAFVTDLQKTEEQPA